MTPILAVPPTAHLSDLHSSLLPYFRKIGPTNMGGNFVTLNDSFCDLAGAVFCRLNLAVLCGGAADRMKWVRLHICRPVPRPEPPGRVLLQQARNQVPCGPRLPSGSGPGRRELERGPHDVAQGRLVGGPRERGPPVNHLVDEHPKRPPVDRAAVGPAARHLGSHVLVSPDEGARPGRDGLGHEPEARCQGRPDLPGPEEAAAAEREAGEGGGRRRARGGVRGLEGGGGVGAEGEVKVGEHDVAVGSNKHVLRL
ncbi:translation initiation factor 3 (IF-3) family protein [Striga asiatica]|uniref:Translation initiation factor 3 (IF-3) family protein n=1 Tax=Striga asiatica TaxID=4170 RepID=A0A5A7NWD4_STRAF|nr:translation initiation factor 3 (IF-3) family protein [Striga asiatica]